MDDIGRSVNRNRSEDKTLYSKIFLLLFSMTVITILVIIGLYTYRNYSLLSLVTTEEPDNEGMAMDETVVVGEATLAVVQDPSTLPTMDLTNVDVTLNPAYDWQELIGTEAAQVKETSLIWYNDEENKGAAPVEGTVWRAEVDTNQTESLSFWPFIQSEESLMQIGWDTELVIDDTRLVPNSADNPIGRASGLLVGADSNFKMIFSRYIQTQSQAYYEVLISDLLNFTELQSRINQ